MLPVDGNTKNALLMDDLAHHWLQGGIKSPSQLCQNDKYYHMMTHTRQGASKSLSQQPNEAC